MTNTETKPKVTEAQMVEVERFLRVRGWEQSEGDYQIYLSADHRWSIALDPQTDLAIIYDLHISEEDGAGESACSINALRDELVNLGAMEWECENCGEIGGTPRSWAWDEWQGDAAHGGRVTFEEIGCSKCIR